MPPSITIQRERNTPMRLAPRVAVPILFLATLAVSGFTTQEPAATAADELPAVTVVTDMDVRTARKLARPIVTCTAPLANDAPEAAQRRLDYYWSYVWHRCSWLCYKGWECPCHIWYF